MVSSCELRFDEVSVAEQKAIVPDDFIYLFQESDRRIVYRNGPDGDDVEIVVRYVAPRAVVLHRLDLAGHTEVQARKAFEAWLNGERESYAEYVRTSGGWADVIAAELSRFNYCEWKRRLKNVLLTRYQLDPTRDVYIDEIDRCMRSPDDAWIFFSDDLTSIRAMLDAMTDVHEVSLDISELINGGWIGPTEKICDNRRAPNAQRRSALQPTVIIAEGGTDIAVLKRSLARLHPYLTDYVTFFDYDGSSADGGADYLVKFLRAFAATRMNTPILAVFDNDAAGNDAFSRATRLALPNNIRVTRLPDIELARAYPTLGPQGQHEIDINGQAVSIELFLGVHNLRAGKEFLSPIVWGSYVQGIGRYQGALQDKRAVLTHFLADTAEHDDGVDYRRRFPELVALWDHILRLLRPSIEDLNV